MESPMNRHAVVAAVLVSLLLGAPAAGGRPPADSASAAEQITSGTSANAYGISPGGNLQFLAAADRDRTLDDMVAAGVTRLRFDVNWAHIQRDGRNSYDWVPYDALVDAAVARGLEPLGTVAYTPKWARPAECRDDDKCAPAKLRDYASFVSTAVDRYAGRGVRQWEIWNEPNIVNFWKPAPDAARYGEMLKLAYPAVKDVDPGSLVVSGGTSPATDNGTNIAPITFLQGVYGAGAAGYFDALGHHPYSFPAAPGEYHEWSAWSQMADTSPSLRSVMADNNDGSKPIWITEFGAPSDGSDGVGESTQAQFVTDAYDLVATYPWAGPLYWYNHQDGDTADDSFGLRRADWSAKPAWDAYSLSSP
jgi:hypothetical protein